MQHIQGIIIMDNLQKFVVTIVNPSLKKKFTSVYTTQSFEESVREAYTAKAKLGHGWKITSVSAK
mgnify:CR=1 FL=1